MAEHHREDDSDILPSLKQQMADFIEQTKEDREFCKQRYERDRQESQEFRQEVRARLEVVENFISGLKPDHKLLMLLATGIIVGALSLVWRLVWTNISFHK